MAVVYVEADSLVRGKITLTKGKQADEEINLIAYYDRDGKQQSKDVKGKIKFTGNEVRFEWDTKGVLLDKEMFLPVRLMLTVGAPGRSASYSGQTQWKTIPIVLYRPTIEILAVDETGKPVEGAGCKLTIHVDEGFEASQRKWREDYTIGQRGEKEWTHKTDKDGKVVFTNLPLGAVTIQWVPPYALRPYGWRTEGDYTETGWKRKAGAVSTRFAVRSAAHRSWNIPDRLRA